MATIAALSGFEAYYSRNMFIIVSFILFAVLLLLLIPTLIKSSITIDDTAITQVSLFRTTTISKAEITLMVYSKGGARTPSQFIIYTDNKKKAIYLSLMFFSKSNQRDMARLLGITDYFHPKNKTTGYGFLIVAVSLILYSVILLSASTKPTFNNFQTVTGVFDLSASMDNGSGRSTQYYICLKDGGKYQCTVFDNDKSLRETFEKNAVPGENIQLKVCDVSSSTSTQIVAVTISNITYLSYDQSVQYFTDVHKQYRIAGICLIPTSGIFVLLFIFFFSRRRNAIKVVQETDYSTGVK